MGEARKKRISLRELLQQEPRCIYCDGRPETIDHMPSISMFRERNRPKGYEFASCATCNRRTKPAESVAGFLARLRSMKTRADPLICEAIEKKYELSKDAPDFLAELRGARTVHPIINGIFRRDLKEITIDGPVITAYLAVFGAKLAMALHRQIVGEALSLSSHIFTTWYSDRTLGVSGLEVFKRSLPNAEKIKQGKLSSEGSFGVMFNIDQENKTLISLSRFHDGLSIFSASSGAPEYIEILKSFPKITAKNPKQYLNLLPIRKSLLIRKIG